MEVCRTYGGKFGWSKREEKESKESGGGKAGYLKEKKKKKKKLRKPIEISSSSRNFFFSLKYPLFRPLDSLLSFSLPPSIFHQIFHHNTWPSLSGREWPQLSTTLSIYRYSSIHGTLKVCMHSREIAVLPFNYPCS
jgi:hypothetical protein